MSNPADYNTVFQLGKFLFIALAVLAVIAFVCMVIGKIVDIFELSSKSEKALKIIGLTAFYAVAVWLGGAMLSAYWGKSLIDVANGGVLLLLTAWSLWVRFGKNDWDRATSIMKFAYGLFVVMLLWFIGFSLIQGILPENLNENIMRLYPKYFYDFWQLNF